jgi:hypothetical protein
VFEVEGAEMESGMERRMIEELLKKYGFGSWVKPEEVWRGRDFSKFRETTEEYSATTRLANVIPSTD